MARIAAQWLRGSDLQMVLAQDLSSVVHWLRSISTLENRIKQLSHFFFFFLNFQIFKFEIRNLNFFFSNKIKRIQRKIKGLFFFFLHWSLPVFCLFFLILQKINK
jgi:hypothetical protein